MNCHCLKQRREKRHLSMESERGGEDVDFQNMLDTSLLLFLLLFSLLSLSLSLLQHRLEKMEGDGGEEYNVFERACVIFRHTSPIKQDIFLPNLSPPKNKTGFGETRARK